MNSFKIYEAEVIDRALKINDTLIISDIHLGYESTLNKQGLMLPQIQFDKIIDSLENIQKKAKASSIILNGDIKHNFGRIDKQEWREVLSFIDYLQDIFIDIDIIKGNHDNFTQYILNKRNLHLKNHMIIDNYYITHGHELPQEIPENIKTIKTYLKGTWQNYNLIVIPSFTQISYGSDILHEKTISPFIEDINNFEVIAVEEGDIYPFGYVKDIISINHELNNY